jgi:hypothetical protein
VRDVAVSVSLSADTAADQADGAIAHPAPGSLDPRRADRFKGL